MAIVDKKTPRLGLLLPNADNFLQDDVERLIQSFDLLDVLVVMRDQTTGKIADDQLSEVIARLDAQGKIATSALPSSVVQKGADGKIDASVLPSIAIIDSFPVPNEASMLGLQCERGDIAIRTDLGRSFILTDLPPSKLSNWRELTSTNVTSVNGQVGAITGLAKAGVNDDITQLTALSGPLRLGGDAVGDYDAVTMRQLREELDDRRTIESFGADIAGVTPSDQALEDGLAWSSATGNTLVITGKVRITRTVNQPVHSVVECPGLVFCTDPSGLTDGWMWDVSGSNSGGNRTRIKSLVLSSAPSTETNEYIGRSMKGLRVRTAHVQVDLCYTYGCRDGGVEFGPTGFEIFGGTISCYVRGSEAYNASAVGVKMSTTDCGIQNLVAVNYPIAAHLGTSNFADNVHVWGLPATSGNLYPDMQMLTGVHFGAATRANYIYIDTHDTAAYDTAPSGDLGVGVVFNGWENSVGTILYRIHPESKAGKLKLLRFKGQYNSIEYITIPGAGSEFDKTAPIIYDADAYKWYNLIFNSTHQKEINRFTVDVSALMPSGVTAATGTMSLEKVGRTVAVTLYYSITGVDTGVAGDFTVPLPAGLKLRTSTVNALTERTCLTSHPSAAGGSDFVFIGGDSKLRVRQRNASTGQAFVLQNSNLRTGALDINIQAPIE